MPVIVQRVVEASHSGVAFSCDPLTYERYRTVVSWTTGLGSSLMNGTESGTTLAFDAEKTCSIPGVLTPKSFSLLVTALRAMEDRLQTPIDMEWAVDENDHFWVLQARPIVLPCPSVTPIDSTHDFVGLPSVIASHSKIALRAAAARRGVRMSRATIITGNGTLPLPTLSADEICERAAGLSVVLLHPTLLNDEVQREFAQVDGTDVPLFTLGCRRFAIRKYPSAGAVATVATNVLERGLGENWFAGVVMQEIYDAEATGIVRRLGDDFVVELARGHFVPKGVVDPSRFVISAIGAVLEGRRAVQDTVYHFVNGYVVTECPVERQVALTDEEIADAVLQIAPLFSDYPSAALEFGVLKQSGCVEAYVIDVAESEPSNGASSLSRQLITSGVLSPGRATGTVVRIGSDEDIDLDQHLESRFSADDIDGISNAVFFADRASVELLPLVNRCDASCAFVFRHAALLAHLCVVLRERGITAVLIEDDHAWTAYRAPSQVSVDAMTSDLTALDRIAQSMTTQ
jgi:hypothetical protein